MSIESDNYLFIGPQFNSYHEAITQSLIEKGNVVKFVPEKKTGMMFDLLFKYLPLLHYKLQKYLLVKRIKSLGVGDFTHLFIIRGEFVDSEVINQLKARYNFLHFVSYQWDSVLNNKMALTHKQQGFDIFSFDRKDCSKYSFTYLPLFYIYEQTKVISNNVIYDLSFVGVYSDARLDIFSKLLTQLKMKNIKYKVMFKISPMLFLYKYCSNPTFRNIDFSYFTFFSIKYNDVLVLMNQSKAILDICHASQSGLTMRSIESIGLNKKLITNNAIITQEPFFTESMVYVFQDNTINDLSFINTKSCSYYNKNDYSLTNWLDKMLGDDEVRKGKPSVG